MARYERGDEFWDITLDGATLTITTGKLGTAGTVTVEQVAPAIAGTRFNVLQNQRVREGWKLWKPPPVERGVIEPALPQVIVYDTRNPELEVAIAADPENLALYEVYGDWLQGQGDPRGKLIALEVAARDKPTGDKHHAAIGRWFDAHRVYFTGGFVNNRGRRLDVRLGFPWHLELLAGRFTDLEKILKQPACRFLSSIHLDAQADDDDPEAVVADMNKALAVIAKRAPKTLRRLELGGQTTLDDLGPLAKRLPELRRFALASIADRQLAVSRRAMQTLARTSWPHLEELTLELMDNSDSSADAEDVIRWLSGALPRLTSLTLRTYFDAAPIVEVLVTSPLAGQLEELVFEDFNMLAARYLVEHREAFRSLKAVAMPLRFLAPAQRDGLAAVYELRDVDEAHRYDHDVE